MSFERKPLASVNITPLVDVLLILLVVVMLSMPMFVKKLPVDLPQTELTGQPVVAKTLMVSLLESGGLMVDDSPVSLEDIKRKVTPQTSVELAVDQAVQYAAIAKTVAALQKMNPKDIALITR